MTAKKVKKEKYVTFQELRQLEREEEMAFTGPGTHDISRDFGVDVHHKMHFGAPFDW